MNLTAPEIRVLGCLLEKQRTTPDVYPLSLNALRIACNQTTNRDPVVQYDEDILRDALHRLGRRGFTRLTSGAGSRTAKFRHLLAEALPLSEDEQATVCVLMLRGPQTPGELKQRTERMHAFADLAAVHETLERLIERGLVARLERRPGQKEERYSQLLGDPDAATSEPGSATNATAAAPVASAQVAAAPPIPAAPSAALAPSTTALAGEHSSLVALTERVDRLERALAELVGRSDGQPAQRRGEPDVAGEPGLRGYPDVLGEQGPHEQADEA